MRQKTNAAEIEFDFVADQLLAPFSNSTETLEIDDLNAIESADQPEKAAALAPHTPALDETSEIELTPEQMDAMLEGRWP